MKLYSTKCQHKLILCIQPKDTEQTRKEDCESVKRVKQPAKAKKMSDSEILAALREFLEQSCIEAT